MRLHDLRHGAATVMLAAGIDIKIVQEILGHSDRAITSDTYTSVLPELAAEAITAAADVINQHRRTPTETEPHRDARAHLWHTRPGKQHGRSPGRGERPGHGLIVGAGEGT
ncbi:tyrosine-type recombinase/integrase [Spirillospora sp. NPDC048911]|uniref:tyrosine-type recombinase/integrase n=1 Tax=Spirillospora sp. NPDC048911 TaxID=3364527 RepID=UPI003724B9C6